MQIRVEDVSPVEKKLIVEVPWDLVSQKLGVAYRELGRGVAIKGFRKGKAPRSVLEQLYGPRVKAEVAVDLIRESFYRGVAEHQLAAVSEPRDVEGAEIKKGEPFTFNAIVEVKAEFEPKDYIGMPLERRKLAIEDDAVDKALDDVRRERTELVPIEGRDTTEAADVLALNITGTIGEHPVDQKRFVVELDDPEREPVPGLFAALTGVPIATAGRQLELPIGDDWKDENLRGRVAKLTVSILEARAKDVPALDDELAKDTGRADTLDEPARQAARGHRAPRAGAHPARVPRRGPQGAGQAQPDPGRVGAGRSRGRDAVEPAAGDAGHARRPGPRPDRTTCARRWCRPRPTRSAASSCSRPSPRRSSWRSPTRRSTPTSPPRPAPATCR